jgi:hypothetical protein
VNFLAQVDPKTIWNAPNGSPELYAKLALGFFLGLAVFIGLMFAPSQVRKPVVWTVIFASGLFYVLFWAFPAPISRAPTDAPRGSVEALSFWLSDAQGVVATLSNVIGGFMIGLGIYSLLRVHIGKVFKQQRDWGFSAVLVVCVFLMAIFGFLDWGMRLNPANFALADPAHWGFINYAKDLMFDGLLQNMDAAMFSVVGFYIMSAAYRAFRARSIEATILLVTALIVILSLMGVVELLWSGVIDKISPDNPIVQSFKLSEVAGWLKGTIQTPAIRGIDFGVGIGLLAMGMRIWLSLEKTGVNN